MAYDYDKLHGETRDALGEPTRAFVDFFYKYDRHCARVLDLGCGQGRDAVFIARRGHTVLGVDLSSNGIRDLKAAARAEALAIEGVVADIATYVPQGDFDVIVSDRTLHMLPDKARRGVFALLLDHVSADGWILVADEETNIGDFETALAVHAGVWATEYRKPGYLFARRA